MVVGGVQGDEEVSYSRGNAGKRIDVCMPSILPDWGSNGSIMIEFYVNGQFVHFLVCGQLNLALTRRYSRIFTGAIGSLSIPRERWVPSAAPSALANLSLSRDEFEVLTSMRTAILGP